MPEFKDDSYLAKSYVRLDKIVDSVIDDLHPEKDDISREARKAQSAIERYYEKRKNVFLRSADRHIVNAYKIVRE